LLLDLNALMGISRVNVQVMDNLPKVFYC
jgi:hypothetical protein